jgi:hypothetical protein
VKNFWFFKKGCKGSSRCKSEPRVNWSMGFPAFRVDPFRVEKKDATGPSRMVHAV